MPLHRRKIDGPRDDLWKENEAIFRRLYLKEHKKLKDVKKVMESEHGFPMTPLSTYESKLRDLGLRKNMKSKNWGPVYQRYVNSGYRHTAIFFKGTRIPWDKAWKEIRRSGARESNGGLAVALPPDVFMRTPSPVLFAQHFSPWCRPLPIPWHLSDAPLVGLSLKAMFHRLSLYDIPSNLLRIEMLNTAQQSPADILRETNASRDHYPPSNPTDQIIEYAISPQFSNHAGHNLDIDRLSSALYRLANDEMRCINLGRPSDKPLDVILNQTPKHVLLKILERDSPTIRAATETLIRFSRRLGRKNDVCNIIETVARCHPEWILDDKYLQYTAGVGYADSCRLLLQLQIRHRSEGNHKLCHCHNKSGYANAVLESVARGHVECAKMLYQHVIGLDPTLLQPGDITAHELFCGFLQTVADGFYDWIEKLPFDLGTPAVLQILNWFLETGADIDLPVRFYNKRGPHYVGQIPLNWRPTILDHIFFKNVELYSYLVSRSTKFVTELTRSGIYLSAKQGVDSLRAYLLSRPSHTPAQQDAFVDIVLTEELLRCAESHTDLDFDVIHTLLRYNIGLPEFPSDLNASIMLYCVVKAAVLQGVHPAVPHIMRILIHKGAVIGTAVMDRAVETKGTTLLQFLSSYGADFKRDGTLALRTAIRLDNYDATDLLLDMGVDINSTFRQGTNEGERSTSLAQERDRLHIICGHQFGYKCENLSPASPAMLEYLVSRNLDLKANPSDISRQQSFRLVIKHLESIDSESDCIWGETLENFQLLLSAELLTDGPSSSRPCLLEALFPFNQPLVGAPTTAEIIPVIEFMLKHGVPIRQSGVLSHLIHHGAPRDEIQRILDGGADIDAYCGRGLRGRLVCRHTPMQAAASIGSLDWVQFLLQMGADVNRPAKGCYGRTALQAACEAYGEIDLIEFLIANGADVNAPPASNWGVTALQAAAIRGNFEVALLLLDHGAHINTPGSKCGSFSALDGAASNSKLDMVQFLLGLGAFSNNRGESGYRGAIRKAEKGGHWAIADIIRQYALTNGKSGEELSIPSSQWEDDSSSECSCDLDSTDESETEINAGLEGLPGF
ncbi:hypothetical protein ANO14919_072300 [Xylariales sp. No.14919]|nr:hypothetical protein ANO14919_072300 [Xylariales sp. No.14919]